MPEIPPELMGRRRPRMAQQAPLPHTMTPAWSKDSAPGERTLRTVGQHPRGPGVCPECGESVKRLAAHMRTHNPLARRVK